MAEQSLTWETVSGLYPQLRQALDDRSARHPWHALLIAGPGGIGKHRMAQLLAQAVLCVSPGEKPCGHCAACHRVQGGTHGNLILLSPLTREKSIKIDPTRRVVEALSLHPLEAGLRVVLIPDVDLMTEQAQNAVLKSLEEPDAGTVFLLTTSNQRAVLPTMISRCRVVRLAPWPDESVLQYLKGNGVGQEDALTWAKLAAGRPLDALNMAMDDRTKALLRLMNDTFMGISALPDVPQASGTLKNTREDAGTLLQLLEGRISALLPQAAQRDTPAQPGWDTAPAIALRRVLEGVFQARQYLMSNVSWQAIADRLLITIAKEIHQCPV